MNVYIPKLPGISLPLLPTTLTHFPVSLRTCFLTEQLVISLSLGSRRRPGFLGCQKSLAEGAPTSCGFHAEPFTPPSGYPGDVPWKERKAKIKGRIKKLGTGWEHPPTPPKEVPGREETSTPACRDQQKGTSTPPPPGAQPTKIAPDPKDMNRIATAESFD